MCKQALDMYDVRPQAMTAYLGNYGWHFNEGLCEFAVSLMYSEDENGNKTYTKYKKKEEVEALLTKHSIRLKKPLDYDFVYLYHAYCTDLKGTEDDEKKLLMITKAIWCDADAADGTIMTQWWAKMVRCGEPVYWGDFV